MNHQKFSAIAHRDHDYCNPIAAAKIERLLDLLPLDETSRVLDLGCGRAELALRIIERFGSTVVAVDHSSLMLDAARERAEWTGALAQAAPRRHRHPRLPGRPGDVPPDRHAGRGRHRRRHGRHLQPAEGLDQGRRLRPGRRGLLAQQAASRLPRVARRRATAQYLDHRGNVQAGIDAGLIPMHAATASMDEWDEYEWKYCRSIERYAREQPDDPDVPAMLERIRRWRDAYLRWGRDTLGFARLPVLSAGRARRLTSRDRSAPRRADEPAPGRRR